MIHQPGDHGDRRNPQTKAAQPPEATPPVTTRVYAEMVTAEAERIIRERAVAAGDDMTAPNWLFGQFAMAFTNGTIAEAARNIAAKGIKRT